MSNLCRECLTRIDDDREYCSDCDRTARGDFEKLGYEQVINDDTKIMYKNKDEIRSTSIIFWKGWKHISWNNNYDDVMYPKEIQAINKQTEELGWNE